MIKIPDISDIKDAIEDALDSRDDDAVYDSVMMALADHEEKKKKDKPTDAFVDNLERHNNELLTKLTTSYNELSRVLKAHDEMIGHITQLVQTVDNRNR